MEIHFKKICFIALLFGVVFPLASYVPSAAGAGPCELTAARDSTETLVPPDYETFLPPPVGSSYCDPVFGTEVKRLTDTQNGYVTNSEIAYFNLDDSYFIATDGVGPITYLFDGRDGHKIKTLGSGTMRPWWIRWPRGSYYTSAGVKNTFDPAKHFYKYEGNQVRLYNVETLNYVVLRTFEEYSEIGPAGGEGDVSQDGRYWVLDGTRTSDGQLELFVYDLLDDRKESVSPFQVGDVGGTGVGADFATISPSGNYIVIAWDAGLTDPYNGHYGVEVFDRATWEFVSRAHVIRIHVELGFDAFGEEVVFTAAGNTPEEIATFGIPGLKLGDQLSVRMRDGFARKLLGIPRYAAFVLSYCPGQPDYIFVGYMDRLASEPWNLYWGEIFALATDGSGKTVRMLHHRSQKVGSQTTKAYQPDFLINNRGDKIIVNSTYGIGGADLYMFDTGLAGGIESIANFDGNGITDVAAFHLPSDQFFTDYAGNMGQYGWGGADGYPLLWDYDGDGQTEVSVYHIPTNQWFVQGYPGDNLGQLGWGGDEAIPVPGDYDGDGLTDRAFYHWPTNRWFVEQPDQSVDAYDFGWGGADCIPIAGDYDGDGVTDMMLYHMPTNQWFVYGTGSLGQFGWNGSECMPVPGDWDGDGKVEIGIYHVSSSQWFWRDQDGTDHFLGQYGWGGMESFPVPGDYNGDGLMERAFYRPAENRWFIEGEADFVWGWGGTEFMPITSQMAVYNWFRFVLGGFQ